MIPNLLGTSEPKTTNLMSSGRTLHKAFFERLADPPPDDSMQWYDGFFPALSARTYTIGVNQTVDAPSGTRPAYNTGQQFSVLAPEFTIDPSVVSSFYPADGASAILGQQLPDLVFTDPSLPWERTLIPPSPGDPAPSDSKPTTWLALVLFAEGEIYLEPSSSTPLFTTSVQDLLAPEAGVLKPNIPVGDVSADLLASQCQTIRIPGTSFAAIPTAADLNFLAHCRAVKATHEDNTLASVLLANRLPVAGQQGTDAVPLRYYAHLVSLEGFFDYIKPSPLPIPSTNGKLDDVQLVSLFNWSFTSLPQPAESFGALLQGLIASETATPVLALPAGSAPEPAAGRLKEGYAPLTFIAGSGEQTFAWYRGPLSACEPQPLPFDPKATDAGADGLMIYLASQGLFDLSYASAWNLGRSLALADSVFATQIRSYARRAGDALFRLRTNASLRSFSGAKNVSFAALLAPKAAKHASAGDLAEALNTLLPQTVSTANHTAVTSRITLRRRIAPLKTRQARIPSATLLAMPEAVDALSATLTDAADPIASWLAELTTLQLVPFSALVPAPGMLPVESIRFFYIDDNWLAALQAGALSLAIQTAEDASLVRALAPGMRERSAQLRATRMRRSYANAARSNDAQPGKAVCGLLVRSALITGWPTLVISASSKGAPVNIVRDATLSTSVRLVLFDSIPDTVTFAEPYQGLQFGVEDNGIAARYVSGSNPIGGQIPNTFVPSIGGYAQLLQQFSKGNGVLLVSALAAALTTATGAADFAIQMVRLPEYQAFTTTPQTHASQPAPRNIA